MKDITINISNSIGGNVDNFKKLVFNSCSGGKMSQLLCILQRCKTNPLCTDSHHAFVTFIASEI
jgi:IS1 family transposase